MQLKVLVTKDGSHTLFSEQFNEIYHSRHGALQESMHVFIAAGFEYVARNKEKIRLLEIGFGTGLNALLTLQAQVSLNKQVEYYSVEPYPVPLELIRELNYVSLMQNQGIDLFFMEMHKAAWDQDETIGSQFILHKMENKLEDILLPPDFFDLIYFDAFAPEKHPALWTIAIFEKMFRCLKNDGVLVTYCAKGNFKRNLKAAGFKIESLPGPSGKREMVRAFKISAL